MPNELQIPHKIMVCVIMSARYSFSAVISSKTLIAVLTLPNLQYALTAILTVWYQTLLHLLTFSPKAAKPVDAFH